MYVHRALLSWKSGKTILVNRICYTRSLSKFFVICISGLDAKKFLQGLVTNDVQLLKNAGDVLPAVLLTAKGRILAPSLLYLKPKPEVGDSIIMELHDKNVAEVQRYLTMYRLRSKVTIKQASLESSIQLDATHNESQASVVAVSDPRHSNLGVRLLKNIEEGEAYPAKCYYVACYTSS